MRGLQSLGMGIERESSFIKQEAAPASHKSTTSRPGYPGEFDASLGAFASQSRNKQERDRAYGWAGWAGGRRAAVG